MSEPTKKPEPTETPGVGFSTPTKPVVPQDDRPHTTGSQTKPPARRSAPVTQKTGEKTEARAEDKL